MMEHLREAEAALAVDGWAPLGQTVERMRALHPDYTLERCKRSSWRQVLNDCGCFEQRVWTAQAPGTVGRGFAARRA